jgi:hypothetical protein
MSVQVAAKLEICSLFVFVVLKSVSGNAGKSVGQGDQKRKKKKSATEKP